MKKPSVLATSGHWLLAGANYETLWLVNDGTGVKTITEDSWFLRVRVCIDGYVQIWLYDHSAASGWYANARRRDDFVVY